MKVVVAYSGGKDSQACLIWACKKYGVSNVKAVFCDTNWESKHTYEAIDKTITKLGCDFETLKSKEYQSLVDLADKRGRFPSVTRRFCTVELKTKPMIDFVLKQKQNLIIIQGIRAGESKSRSKMSKECRFFKYYHEHVGNTGRYYTYRDVEVRNFCKKYDDSILRPVFDWSGQEVIDYIIANGHEPNKLYSQGMKRVGCFPCILTGIQELQQFFRYYPERLDELVQIEKDVGSSFFKMDLIPERYRSGLDQETGKKWTTAQDVKKYLSDKTATIDMFETKKVSCSSHYYLCE